MNDATAMDASRPARSLARGWWVLAGCAGVVAALALLLAFFPWDLLRGPLNRYVSERTGRHFEITRRLDVKLGLTTRVIADGIEFANPEWAKDAYLLKARSAQIDVKLLSLLHGPIELPRVVLVNPVLGLQMEADGRRTWALGRNTADPATIPSVGLLEVDDGALRFVAPEHGADIRTDFGIDARPGVALPLHYKARGTWRRQPFTAQGSTGSVLQLGARLAQPFPLEVNAVAGATSLHATGTVASLSSLDGANLDFRLQGRNLADLYQLIGVVLPETPRYALAGKLRKHDAVWEASAISGRLGNSDLSGALRYDKSNAVPLLSGKVQSASLDFDDLAPLVGLPDQSGSKTGSVTNAAGAPASLPVRPVAKPVATGRVLPTATLDLERLKAMDADVWYSAARINHVRQLPLDRMSVHVQLKSGALNLSPLELGVAGGTVTGALLINGNSNPAAVEMRLGVKSLALNKLFPAIESTRSSLGRVNGEIDLKGRGNSAATMLATSSGDVSLLMGSGQISNILLEYMGLDGGEIIKFLLRGDRNVDLRCAALSFDVKQGRMASRAILLDTSDTVISGTGTVSLATETMDIVLKPLPKDASILSLRSPLHIGGTFAAPTAGPDKAALAGRAGLAIALGLINPLLALAATIETGPGQDADCAGTLRDIAAHAKLPAQAPTKAR